MSAFCLHYKWCIRKQRIKSNFCNAPPRKEDKILLWCLCLAQWGPNDLKPGSIAVIHVQNLHIRWYTFKSKHNRIIDKIWSCSFQCTPPLFPHWPKVSMIMLSSTCDIGGPGKAGGHPKTSKTGLNPQQGHTPHPFESPGVNWLQQRYLVRLVRRCCWAPVPALRSARTG